MLRIWLCLVFGVVQANALFKIDLQACEEMEIATA
jgi:hypothetical protein